MNAIEFALRDVCNGFDIPVEVLQAAFLESDKNLFHGQIRPVTPFSLNQAILEQVIHAKVLPECEVIGGTQHNIALRGARIEQSDPWTTVINIPDSLTMGRKIISVQNLYYGWPDTFMAAYNPGGSPTYASGVAGSGSQISQRLNTVVDSTSQMPEIQSTNIALTGHNTITIFETSLVTTQLTARVTLQFDEQLSTLNPRAYPDFAELVVLATKGMIHKKLWLKINEGVLVGGVELGAFRDEVDGYRDAKQSYKDQLKRMKKIFGYSDKLRKHRILRAIVPKR